MLHTYLDRSELSSGVVIVAGFLSPAERWKRFEKNWREVLDSVGLQYFHMTDFVARRGPYQDWSDTKREDCIRRLIGVTNRTAIFHSTVGLLKPDLDALLAQAEQRQRKQVSSYGL